MAEQPHRNVSAEERQLPETEVGLFLIEIYFTRVFTASLLFEHKSFVEDYHASTLPEYVLLSVFALASLFLHAPKNSLVAKKTGLEAFATLGTKGRSWAEAGSKLVLTNCDKPCLATIRACEILGLYWFAVGELDRSTIYSNESFNPVPELENSNESEQDTSTHGDTRATDISDWMLWDDRSFRDCSFYCVGLFNLWRQAKQFVRRSWNATSSVYLTSFFELDSKLQRFQSIVPGELMDDDVMRPDNPERVQRNSYFLRSMYHLCLVYLNASAVPCFSGSKARQKLSPNLVEFCARATLSNADQFANLSKAYLATTPDFSKVPCFVGYCAFMAGSVHGTMCSPKSTSSASYSSWAKCAVCLLILQELKEYWPVLNSLYQALQKQLYFGYGRMFSFSEEIVRDLVYGTPSFTSEKNIHDVLLPSKALFKLPHRTEGAFILRPYNPSEPSSPDQDDDEQDDNRPNSHGTSQEAEDVGPANDESDTIVTDSFVQLDEGLQTNAVGSGSYISLQENFLRENDLDDSLTPTASCFDLFSHGMDFTNMEGFFDGERWDLG
ncbi:hypothetical protein NA57DRAFT_74727 [Rhizodiscina lignyota]|uniref:Transcription factor domain-containing protein n=1 Tax=Rhizodiscina lignyota TaxID=1504668 RepID=A0A9P4M7X5_9PEZI|nr:hypothetical protein NA57DRAFT_74727 [Rhizodiscina lignyota]